MSLATTLHDVAPVRLRGLTFLALSDLGTVNRRTSVDSRGTWTGGGTWSGSAYSPTAGSWSDTTGVASGGTYATIGTGGGPGWKAGTWATGGTTAGSWSGAQVETFTPPGYLAGSAIPCRVDPTGGGEGQVANRLDERTTHRITVPPQTVVSAKDRFTTFSTTAGTLAYEITAVRKRTDGQVLVLEATEDF